MRGRKSSAPAHRWSADRHAPSHPIASVQRGWERSLEKREDRRQEATAAAVIFWDPGAA